MLTIYHMPPTRSVRIVWLAEELGLPYRVIGMNFSDAQTEEYRAVNPISQFPAIEDGDLKMIESVAIMEYLLARRAPDSDLRLRVEEEDFPAYLQFMHYGEASLLSIGNALVATKYFAPEDVRDNWTVRYVIDSMKKRLCIVDQRLQDREYLVGGRFTAADISVGYSLALYQKFEIGLPFAPHVEAYLARVSARPGFQKGMAAPAMAA